MPRSPRTIHSPVSQFSEFLSERSFFLSAWNRSVRLCSWNRSVRLCSREIVGLKGSCLMLEQQYHNKISTSGSIGSCLTLTQQHHNNHINNEFKGSCLVPTHRQHNKHYSQLTSGSNTKWATTAQANHCRFVIDPAFDVRVHFDKLVTPSEDCKPAGILNGRRWNCTLKRFICHSPSDGYMDGSNWKVCCRRRQRFHCRNGISSHPFIIFLSNREQIRAGVNLYSIAGKQRMNMCKKLLKSLQNIRMQQKYEKRI